MIEQKAYTKEISELTEVSEWNAVLQGSLEWDSSHPSEVTVLLEGL